ncbi:unnamed protein product [Moneuplotes crassus]|uniref:14-3-3 domain-containing protein n=1 Tax=Euplotes crassus TaxID=5936 RepID=A0AAD2CWQ7_EUPCR|nr:unnamed protein product [Moneuplotes crassus]
MIIPLLEREPNNKKKERKLRNKKILKKKQYKVQIEDELFRNIMNLLDDHLLSNTSDSEEKVAYLKMKATYLEYISEFAKASDKYNTVQECKNCYEEAQEIAERDLEPIHPTRLSLFLNFSMFNYEILNEPQIACDMTKNVLDSTISELEHRSNEYSKDSARIIQLFRDSLTLWNSDMEV